MNTNATRAPAALGGSPLRAPRAPADRIVAELDEVVRKSHRRSALRRVLRSTGGAFARLLERAVPPAPPRSEPPPEIRFPFF